MSDHPMKLGEPLALSVKEAAAAIGVSKRHLQTWLLEIPHLYLGDRVLIPVEPFKDWLRDMAKAKGITSDQIANDIVKALHSPTDKRK